MGWLREMFGECVESGTVAVVVLRSPTGWGKTTEVLELYDDLAADQRGARFWPAHIVHRSRIGTAEAEVGVLIDQVGRPPEVRCHEFGRVELTKPEGNLGGDAPNSTLRCS